MPSLIHVIVLFAMLGGPANLKTDFYSILMVSMLKTLINTNPQDTQRDAFLIEMSSQAGFMLRLLAGKGSEKPLLSEKRESSEERSPATLLLNDISLRILWDQWIQELKREHLLPCIEILEGVNGTLQNADVGEQYWIRYFRSIGTELTNIHHIDE